MRLSTGFAMTALVVLGCTRPRPTQAPPTINAGDQTTSAALAPMGANDARTPEGPPAPGAHSSAPRCRLTVTKTHGCGPHDVQALIEPVRPRIEHCRKMSGGKLMIRVQKAPGGKLAFAVEPGSSLDPTEKRCVLEALSTLNAADESSTAWAGLNVRPTGFTSLITLEW